MMTAADGDDICRRFPRADDGPSTPLGERYRNAGDDSNRRFLSIIHPISYPQNGNNIPCASGGMMRRYHQHATAMNMAAVSASE